MSGGREYAGPSHHVGPVAARREPELTPEERQKAEEKREQLRAADLEALERFEQSPEHQLTKEQRFRLSMSHAERLRAADAKAHETKQAGDAAAAAEREQHQQANAQHAAQLVAGVRAAKLQAVPGVVGRVQQARIAGKLSVDASPSILRAMAQATESALLGGIQNGEIAAVVRACCASMGRGETIETFERDMTRLAERLDRVLNEKASRATQPIFAAPPTPEQIAEQIRQAGEGALQTALGERQAAPQTETKDNGEHAVKHVPAFPDGKLRAGDEIEGLSQDQWMSVLSTPHPEGPSIVGPLPIKVAGVVVKRESFLIWTENGKIQGWMPASEIPAGGSRRRDWLLWSDGRALQVVRDRLGDAAAIQAQQPELSGRNAERRADAGQELNRDLEHFVATGSSIEHAQHQVLHAHQDVLATLIQGTFQIFSIWANVSAAAEGIEQLGDGVGRALGKRGSKSADAETQTVHEDKSTELTQSHAQPQHQHKTGDSVEAFVIGKQLPPPGPARWKYIENPEVWAPERRALHEQLLAEAKQQAQTFADAFEPGQQPTMYAMRGNTAAGKSRAAKQNPALAGPMSKAPKGSINPDNFKARLAAEGGFSSSDVHSESSMLATRLEKEIVGIKRTSDGAVGDIVVDKRLATVEDVTSYAKMAKESGRAFHLTDVDAPLETSLAGVLERSPGGDDPLPPFNIVGGGFNAVRANRAAVIEAFISDPEMGSYELYGTTPEGERVKLAEVTRGQLNVVDAHKDLFEQAIAKPAEGQSDIAANTKITDELIARMTSKLDTKRAETVRQALRKYLGQTWRAALDAHSNEKSQ